MGILDFPLTTRVIMFDVEGHYIEAGLSMQVDRDGGCRRVYRNDNGVTVYLDAESLEHAKLYGRVRSRIEIGREAELEAKRKSRIKAEKEAELERRKNARGRA